MKYLACILNVCIIISSCTVRKDNKQSNIALWNKNTLTSIKEQISSANDNALRKELKNHLYAANMFLYDRTGGKDDRPMRAKFLETIFSSDKELKDFFVLEFVQKGERYEIKNMLIKNAENTSQVTFYEYFGNEWHNVGDTILNKIDLHLEIVRPINEKEGPALGVKDVVLSEFEGSNITSHLYPNSMVSRHNLFFGLLVRSINLDAITNQ